MRIAVADPASLGAAVHRILEECWPPAPLEHDRPIRVVIKPNWIEEGDDLDSRWQATITSPELLGAIVGAVARRTQGKAHITLCDAPHTYASFERIVARGRLPDVLSTAAAQWPGLPVNILDLRRETWTLRDGVVVRRTPNPPDPCGYVAVNLGARSMLYQHRSEGKYYGADYDRSVVNAHHRAAVHEYLLAGTPVAADVFINVPKLKTHKKTGITCCIKNLVGINGDKNWLPHYALGTPAGGGDERPSYRVRDWPELLVKGLSRQLLVSAPALGTGIYRVARKGGLKMAGAGNRTIRNGNWQGNDTCWRMAIDLNRAFLYSRPTGELDARHRRCYIAIVDGLIAGEGDGPLRPDPVASGVLIGGTSPGEVDAVAARLMGFDIERLPIVRRAFDEHSLPICATALNDVTAFDERADRLTLLAEIKPLVPQGFRPHPGWPDVNPRLTAR